MKRAAIAMIVLAAMPVLALAVLHSGAPEAAATAAADSVTATLTSLNGSGATGTATIKATGTGTEITVQLAGLQPGSSHMVHVHEGPTCSSDASQLGMHTVDLTNVVADASGNGSSVTTSDKTFAQLADGAHKVVAHTGATGATDADKVPIACGAIPSSTASLPLTGGAPTAGGGNSAWILVGAALAMLGVLFLVTGRRVPGVS